MFRRLWNRFFVVKQSKAILTCILRTRQSSIQMLVNIDHPHAPFPFLLCYCFCWSSSSKTHSVLVSFCSCTVILGQLSLHLFKVSSLCYPLLIYLVLVPFALNKKTFGFIHTISRLVSVVSFLKPLWRCMHRAIFPWNLFADLWDESFIFIPLGMSLGQSLSLYVTVKASSSHTVGQNFSLSLVALINIYYEHRS